MNRQALSPELLRLLNEPLSEPPATARRLWKTLAQAMEKLDNARVQQASYDAEVIRLREELALTKQRDQQALGRALEAGDPDPEPQAPAIEAEIEKNIQRSAAMTDQILEAQRRVAELVLRLKAKWQEDLARHIADAAALYRAAIVQVEQTREALADLVNVGGWLDVFPATGQLAGDRRLVDPLTGRPEPVVAPQRTFSEVFNDLLRDSEQLPLLGPVQPTREFMRWFDRKQIVLDRVDADGSVHPQVFHGDTHAGWKVRDWIKQISEQ